MDQDTRIKITDELKKLLNREPTENEILNGQTDTLIMHRVNERKSAEQATSNQVKFNDIESQVSEVSAAVDISAMKVTPIVR